MIYDNGRAYEGIWFYNIGNWENDFKHGSGYEKFVN